MLSEQSQWPQQIKHTAKIDKVFILIIAQILIPQRPSPSKRITLGANTLKQTLSYLFKKKAQTPLNNGLDYNLEVSNSIKSYFFKFKH